MEKYLLIGLAFIISCTSYQKTSLPYSKQPEISFNKSEEILIEELKLKDPACYFKVDSLFTTKEYKSIEFGPNRNCTTYYIKNPGPYADVTVLNFYKDRLWNLNIYNRSTANNDSLVKLTERFFERKFELDSSQYSFRHDSSYYGKDYKGFENKYTSVGGHLKRKKIHVYFSKDLVYNEINLSLTNFRVKPPSFCGTKTPLWDYLKFWRW